MSFNSDHSAAFHAGSGGLGISASYSFFSGLFVAVLFLWAAWLVLNAYRAWVDSRMTAGEAAGVYVRAVILIIVGLSFVAKLLTA